jgi:hypothetical protein
MNTIITNILQYGGHGLICHVCNFFWLTVFYDKFGDTLHSGVAFAPEYFVMIIKTQGERLGAGEAHRVRAPALEPAAERDARSAHAAGAPLRGAHQAQAARRA